jgi:hypothetical protein
MPEPDREWFADHGRRHLRFRPAFDGEPVGYVVLVHRDGRRWGWPAPGARCCELNSDLETLNVVHAAISSHPSLELSEAAGVTKPCRLHPLT